MQTLTRPPYLRAVSESQDSSICAVSICRRVFAHSTSLSMFCGGVVPGKAQPGPRMNPPPGSEYVDCFATRFFDVANRALMQYSAGIDRTQKGSAACRSFLGDFLVAFIVKFQNCRSRSGHAIDDFGGVSADMVQRKRNHRSGLRAQFFEQKADNISRTSRER